MHGTAGQTDVVETVVNKEIGTGKKQTDNKYMLGEHVVVYWLEGHIARW